MRTPILAILALSLAGATAACGGANPAGPGSVPTVAAAVVDRTVVVLTAPGESTLLTVAAAGRSTTEPDLSLAAERRWLHDVPVLDAAALAAGRLLAAGPGTAEVEARAFGSAPARVTVHVRPARPLLLSAASRGDTVVLRGYRLHQAGAVRVGHSPAPTLDADSATLRILVPPLHDATCRSGVVRERVAASGADVAAGLDLLRRHADELALAVGVPTRLDAARAACLRLAPPRERATRWRSSTRARCAGRPPASRARHPPP